MAHEPDTPPTPPPALPSPCSQSRAPAPGQGGVPGTGCLAAGQGGGGCEARGGPGRKGPSGGARSGSLGEGRHGPTARRRSALLAQRRGTLGGDTTPAPVPRRRGAPSSSLPGVLMARSRRPITVVGPSSAWEASWKAQLRLWQAYRRAEHAAISARLHQAALRAADAGSYKHEAPSGGTERASTTSTRSGGLSGCSDQFA